MRLKSKFLISVLILFTSIAFIMHYFSNRLTSICIETDNEYLQKKISAELEENGIHKGTYIPSIDFNELKNTLCFSIDDINSIVINRTGSKIILKPKESKEKYPVANTENPCNIIADYNMKIVSVKVYKGKLFAPAGSEIRKGDIIISGKYKSKSESTILRHADGDIIAEFKREIIFRQPKSEKIFDYSGKSFKEKKLEFFSLCIPLSNSGKEFYNSYSISSKNNPLKLFERILPISLKTTIYREKIPSIAVYTDEYTEELIEKQKNNFEKTILSEYKIISSESETEVSDDEITEKVTYTLCGNVGVKQDILVCPFA